MCKELLRWPDKSEEEACSCAGACSHQCGQEEGEGMESINIDEYLSILNNSEEELKNLKSPLIWEHKINPMLGLKQVMRTSYFSHCLTLEQKSDTPFGGVLDKIHPFSNPYLNLLQLFNLQGVSSFLPPHNFPVTESSKNNRVPNWPPLKMVESRTCHPQTLVCLGVASSGLCHFLRVARSELYHFWGWPVHDSVIFWILAHREIKGWQEG